LVGKFREPQKRSAKRDAGYGCFYFAGCVTDFDGRREGHKKRRKRINAFSSVFFPRLPWFHSLAAINRVHEWRNKPITTPIASANATAPPISHQSCRGKVPSPNPRESRARLFVPGAIGTESQSKI
jgi:hypothetical protein